MRAHSIFNRLLILGVGIVSLAPASRVAANPLTFQVTYDKSVTSTPFTGRVYVLLTRARRARPDGGPNWFKPEPFYATEVKDWLPGQPITLDDQSVSFPEGMSKLKGVYWAQAVMDFGRGISYARSEGNAYGPAIEVDLGKPLARPVPLKIDQAYHEPPFKETDRVKLVDIESKLLTAFHGRPVHLRAAVALPQSYKADSERRYPVVYVVPGFGGDHTNAGMLLGATNVAGTDMIQVMLDPACYWGHQVFADSENNGPYGQALIQELIPAIESKFRAIGRPKARLVTGHSSGGWSSLWLQVTYPDFFGGVWSTAPDPVDFRDFQRINIYRPGENMFVDEAGKPRPIARMAGKAALFYKPFSDMEIVMGHGGQLRSFEAVFSPKGADGKPMQLWDRTTGKIDPEVAKAWERYDIRQVLEKNWSSLAPKLAGKIHVYMGDDDTFYLEGATILLKESLHKLGSDAVVELFPGKNHGTLMDASLRQRIAKEMAQTFKKAEAR
jgi:S-formylglutathione hydrolase FrmB